MTPESTPKKPRFVKPKPSVRTLPEPQTPDELLPLAEEAFYGLSGEIVREIEPHSEADPAAVLIQFLAAFGSAVGRGPGFKVENDRHHANLFVGIVGETSSARKGSSWGQARRLVAAADPVWATRITTGASSGEGLIWEVRDPSDEDPGAGDKRLLVVEPELASPLERMTGSGNTLSPVLRQAWDGHRLNTLVKTSPATATDAHVSLIGHTTPEELQRKLTATEQANGFANRIIWIFARRSKELPRGGRIDSVNWTPYLKRLNAALRKAAPQGEVDFDAAAWRLWERAYGDLTNPPGGMLGATTARGAPQVRRLALIYALLDGQMGVGAPHLRAALALWRYSADSAALLFGKAIGDPTADRVLAEVRKHPGGLRRTELSRSFGGHRSKDELDRAIAILAQQGLVEEEVEESQGGRRAVRLIAIDQREKRKKRRES